MIFGLNKNTVQYSFLVKQTCKCKKANCFVEYEWPSM